MCGQTLRNTFQKETWLCLSHVCVIIQWALSTSLSLSWRWHEFLLCESDNKHLCYQESTQTAQCQVFVCCDIFVLFLFGFPPKCPTWRRPFRCFSHLTISLMQAITSSWISCQAHTILLFSGLKCRNIRVHRCFLKRFCCSIKKICYLTS